MVNLLNIDKEKEEETSLLEELNDSTMESVSRGVYHIIGRLGYNHFQNKASHLESINEQIRMGLFMFETGWNKKFMSDVMLLYKRLCVKKCVSGEPV